MQKIGYVADATRMQLGRRAVAIATTLIVLAVGWLGARHEAEVAHVREQSGRVVHGQELADHHDAEAGHHLHGRELRDDHGGACALLAVTPSAFAIAAPVLAGQRIAQQLQPRSVAPADVIASVAPYRLAPKTSPPAHG